MNGAIEGYPPGGAPSFIPGPGTSKQVKVTLVGSLTNLNRLLGQCGEYGVEITGQGMFTPPGGRPTGPRTPKT